MKKIGFIGMGNMAKALAEGFIASGNVSAADVYAYAPNQEKLAANAAAIGFSPCAGLEQLAAQCDTLIMACKPYQIEAVLVSLERHLPAKRWFLWRQAGTLTSMLSICLKE